jgi:hypothetical protein
VQKADRAGAAGSADFQPQEPVDSPGLIFLSLSAMLSLMRRFSLSLMRSRLCLRKGRRVFHRAS